MKKLWPLIALICFSWHSAFAKPANEKIYAVTEEFAPYNYTEHKKLTGYSVKIAEALLKRAGFEYQMNIYPWARAYYLAQTKPNVLIFTIAKTPERRDEFHWIGAIGSRKLYLYKLSSRKDLNVNTLDDVKRYVIGIDRNDASEQLLKQNGFVLNKNLDPSPDESSNLKKLLIGRIDFIAGSDITVPRLASSMGIKKDVVERSILIVNQGEYFMAMSKSTSLEVVERMREVFSEIQTSGLLNDLRTQFGIPAEK